MKYIYYFGFLCLFCITPQRVFSQQVPDSTEVIEEFEDLELDSSNLNCNDSLSIPLVPFDTSMVPSASIYRSWNHMHVNPYDTDMVKKTDTTLICLKGYCPPKKNYITSDFGFRRWRHHYGVDLKVQIGDTILSAFDGMIRICKYSRSYGNYIVVRHYNGLETIYGHLSRSFVSINQLVQAGEPIGLGGSTGRSTGPHLHFEVRYLGQCINPHDIIDFDNYKLKSDTLMLSASHFAYLAEIRKIRYHKVRRGETLGHIAIRYGVPLRRLYQLNHLRKSKLLRIGQRIRYT
jgi:hypothetical protein